LFSPSTAIGTSGNAANTAKVTACPNASIPNPAIMGPANPEIENPSALRLKFIGRSSGRPM